jgi:hypothetical protein
MVNRLNSHKQSAFFLPNDTQIFVFFSKEAKITDNCWTLQKMFIFTVGHHCSGKDTKWGSANYAYLTMAKILYIQYNY